MLLPKCFWENCNETGEGLERDLTKAVNLYRAAAESGHAGAMVNLGNCFRDGIGVEADKRRR